MSIYANAKFWVAVAERALKTFAQTAAAILSAGVVLATVTDVDWVYVVGASGLAAVYSVLTSIASAQVGEFAGPSLADEAVIVEPVE